MADECVVCGEAEEGKPVYKKLGSGEFNVEVITALKALQMVSIPEAAKNNSYICWDCDELIVEQYDRYLREQKASTSVRKPTKKKPEQQQSKKKKKPRSSKLKLKISKDSKRDSSWGIAKPRAQRHGSKKPDNVTKDVTSTITNNVSKTKLLEQQRATNAYHSSHCLMCDSNFETERRTYQRFSLKKIISDEMDIAQVMEVLGLARQIAPNMKARRFVCNPCFFIIRRNYKDKLMKEGSEGGPPLPLSSTLTSLGSQRVIHRATTEEHAAEIAKLLPPDLAECYKIVTENPINKNHEPVYTAEKNLANESICEADEEELDSNEEEGEEEEVEEEEEEEGSLKVSQDEHGNYFIDVHDKGCVEENKFLTEQEEQPAVPKTTRRKKNVLLPRRMHKHLSLSPPLTPERHSDTLSGKEDGDDKEEECKKTSSHSFATTQELRNSRKCNICGITIAGKSSSWWHTLSSPLDGFDSINVTIALKLLETCLTSRDQKLQEDQSVCLPCYSKVSTGFKSQVVQRIARHRNMDVSKVNLSRVKVRMLPKETPEPSEVLGLQEKLPEAAESAEVPRSSERTTGTGDIQPMSEEGGEGEKENMDIEKHGQKRKLDEGNVLSDKKSKLHRSEVDVTVMSAPDSNETKNSQDHIPTEKLSPVSSKGRTGNRCFRSRNGRFLKKIKGPNNGTSSIAEFVQQSGSFVNDGQEEKPHPPQPQASQEILRKQNQESKETEPMVVLKDLKFVLPQEAFSGKTVSSHKIESIIDTTRLVSPDQPLASHSDLGTTTSPLQLVFSALSTYHPPKNVIKQVTQAISTQEHAGAPKGNIHCVVCGRSYMVPLSSWHSMEEYIRPPTLLVPVRWVCISLAISLPSVSVEDVRHARVCKNCFEWLGDHFEVFVKRKVGESCGLEAEAVDLSEYLFTFNTETMNLEADPKQQSYIHEFEDVGQLLQRIQVLMEQFSLDEVIGEGKRQPVLEQHFCVWLLLVLNELRMQVGAAIGDLAHWLVTLMPVDMYESGLRPCPNNLASFLLSTTRCSKDLTEDVLEGAIPAWVFVANETFHATHTGKVGITHDNDNEEEDLCWEDYLHHVNLDALVGGKATPVSAIDFTQGLVYAVWRTSQLLGEGEQQVVDWLRQLSPLPLSKEQLENLVIMIGQLHNHLEEHPEDVHELECAIIPQLQNEHCASQSSSDGEKVANSPLRVEAYNSCVSEEDRSNVQAYNSSKSKKDANTHIYISPESKKGKSNVWSTKKIPAMKNRKGSPTLQTPKHKRTKRLKSLVSNVNVKGHKSNYSKKTTVSSPSQIIASEGDTQSSCIPHSDNHPDDSDATLVHSNTNIILAKPESMLDGAIAQIPLDSTTICEPDPTVLSHSGSKYITEQCGVVTAPTTSSVQSKETKVTSQLSKKTVVTNGSSKGTATNNQLGTETVAIIESCEDTVAISDLDEDIETTTEASKETETLEETITNDDPDKEIADIIGTSEVTTATIEPNEEAFLNNKTSEKTVTIIGTSEQTTATTEFNEVTVNTVETVTTTEPTDGTSEETVATTGSAEDTVTTAELNEETVVFRDTLEGTKGTSRTSEETVATTKPAEDTLAIIDTSEKNASPIEPTEKTVPTTELTDKSATLSGASEETVVTSGTSEETAGTSGSLKEMAITNETSEESAVTSGSSKVMAVTSGISEEMAVTNVTSEESAVTSGTPEETAVTKGTSEEIAVTNRTSKGTAVSSGISVETAVLCESFEEVSTTEESLESTSLDTTVLVTKKSSTVTPLEETGTNNETSGKTAATSESCKENRTTCGTPEETIAANEPTKNTVVSVGSSEEIAGTVEAFKVSVASPEQPKGTLTTLGLGQDIEVTSQCPGDVMVTTHDTTVIQKSSVVSIATNDNSPKNVGTIVHSKETASATPTLSIADGNITTPTICTHATGREMNAVITSTQHSASSPLTNTIVTPDTGSMANTTQLTIAPQEAVVTKNTVSRTVKAEISKPQIIQCANALKTLGSSTTMVSPPSKSISDNTGQHSVITVSQNSMNSKKISRQALGHGSHAILKRTNEDGQNITNLQESALRKSPETQTEFEQKNEHHVDNLKQKGSSSSSKRSFSGISNSPTKVCIVTVPKKGNTPHQMEDSVGHAKKKDCLKVVHKYKTDTHFKNNVVLPPKNSEDMELIQSKKELSQEVPLVVSSTKPTLHRSERFCISSRVKTLTYESHKGENSLGSKKENKWLYQNTCKERPRTERVDNKNSHGCSPIHFESHQEGREDNNNTETPSLPSSSASSKSVVRLVSADHIKDKLEHTNESEKYDLKDTNACTIQKMIEKIPTMNDTKQKESYVERIPESDNKVPDASVRKVKNTSVENYCDKEKVDEIPENYIHKQIKTNKKYHQPVTPKSHEEVMLKKKKFHEKTPGKSLPLEENKQSIKGKFSSSIATPEKSMNKSVSGVTPSKQKVACRIPKGLPEKKQKLTFEELMNYDAA